MNDETKKVLSEVAEAAKKLADPSPVLNVALEKAATAKEHLDAVAAMLAVTPADFEGQPTWKLIDAMSNKIRLLVGAAEMEEMLESTGVEKSDAEFATYVDEQLLLVTKTEDPELKTLLAVHLAATVQKAERTGGGGVKFRSIDMRSHKVVKPKAPVQKGWPNDLTKDL